MKSYSNMRAAGIVGMGVGVIVALVPMRVALDLDVARHDEEAVLDAHHLDLRAVEPRQHRPGDDFVDRADHRRAGAQIEHPVDRVDQRIELVGAEEDRDLQFVAQPPRDVDDALLVGRIERDQGFVEQQQARPAEQRLAQQQALALAARELADRAARQLARVDVIERPVDFAPRRLVEPGEAETRADGRAGDDVVAGQTQARDGPRFCGI